MAASATLAGAAAPLKLLCRPRPARPRRSAARPIALLRQHRLHWVANKPLTRQAAIPLYPPKSTRDGRSATLAAERTYSK